VKRKPQTGKAKASEVDVSSGNQPDCATCQARFQVLRRLPQVRPRREQARKPDFACTMVRSSLCERLWKFEIPCWHPLAQRAYLRGCG